MRTGQRIGLGVFGVVLTVLGGLGFFLFDGDLDSDGHYEILRAVSYSPNRVAFEIQRTDHQALNGPRYAVLISDHVPTTLEMKRAIISYWRHSSFTLADRSVSIQWTGPNLLTLTTTEPGTNPDWIVNQRHKIGDVTVNYSGQP
ncbi:MAG: hypothetical protein ACRYGF_06370 [Janthinobacterium lividum]